MIEPIRPRPSGSPGNETKPTEHEASVAAAGCDSPTPTTVRSAVAGADCQSDPFYHRPRADDPVHRLPLGV
jgi:hypothetical protein